MKTETKHVGFLEGGGEMGALVRNYDWEKTCLGKPETWPLSLQTTVGIVLHSAFPMFLFWGKELLCFYNDAYRPSLGKDGKHPLIGKAGEAAWPDIWSFIGPLIEKVMTTGEAVWFEDQFLPIYRNGKMEDVYWTFSYSPAYGDFGEVEGVFVTCTETTVKVNALEELKESKNRLQFAIDAADLGTWELNPATSRFRGNTRLKEWFGLKPEEDIALDLAISVIAEKDREKVKAAIARALTYESGGHYDVEYTIHNPNTGKEVIVKAKGKAHFDEDKKPYTFSGTLQDVTTEATMTKQLAIELKEQKLVRQKVEESEAHLQLLRDTVPAMIFYLDAEQRYKSYNVVFMEWFGVNATEAIGKTVREFTGEEDYKKTLPHLARAYSGHQTSYEMLTRQKKGDAKWLNIVYKPHISTNGHVIGVIAHATDVTQSKQTEISLRNSEARFRGLIEEAPIATCVFTGKELKIEIANEIMLHLWGKDHAVIGMTLKDALPHINVQPIIHNLEKVYASGKPYSENAARRELEIDGVKSTYYFNYTYKPLFNEMGEVYGIMDVAVDVTDQILVQKRTEESELFSMDVFYNSPVAKLVFVGREMKIERINENMLRILGRDASIVGKLFKEAVPELLSTDIMDRLLEVFTSGVTFTQQERKIEVVRFGEPYTGYYNYIYKPLVSTSGEIYGIMVTATEVTEQVIARKMIEAKEKELRDLINSAPIGICVLRGIEVRIEEVNEKFILISGKKREQFVDATYWEVFPEVAEPFAPILENVFKTGIKYPQLRKLRKWAISRIYRAFPGSELEFYM